MKRKILKITFFIAAISTGIAVNSIENLVPSPIIRNMTKL